MSLSQPLSKSAASLRKDVVRAETLLEGPPKPASESHAPLFANVTLHTFCRRGLRPESFALENAGFRRKSSDQQTIAAIATQGETWWGDKEARWSTLVCSVQARGRAAAALIARGSSRGLVTRCSREPALQTRVRSISVGSRKVGEEVREEKRRRTGRGRKTTGGKHMREGAACNAPSAALDTASQYSWPFPNIHSFLIADRKR